MERQIDSRVSTARDREGDCVVEARAGGDLAQALNLLESFPCKPYSIIETFRIIRSANAVAVQTWCASLLTFRGPGQALKVLLPGQ